MKKREEEYKSKMKDRGENKAKLIAEKAAAKAQRKSEAPSPPGSPTQRKSEAPSPPGSPARPSVRPG